MVGGSRSSHVTRMTPSRGDDLLDGGSLYWVMSGLISARQRIDGLESFSDSDGIRRCRIVLDGRIVRVRPTPHRAFQGWRYFRASDVPPDLDSGDGVGSLPDGLRAELASLDCCLEGGGLESVATRWYERM